MNTILKRFTCCFVVSLLVVLGAVLVPMPAYAEGIDLPTEEELLTYEADGTLEERIAYQESLDALPSGELLALMEADGAQTEFDLRGTMPKTGTGRVFAVRVAFPGDDYEDAMFFDEGDSVEALDAIIDGQAQEFPYESLAAYYYRSSYGKLTISGDAFDYTAQYPRSYYYDTNALVEEVLTAFDKQVDYGDYDGNDDGIIDCVVIRFAGEDEGWGSMWWSNAALTYIGDEDGNIRLFDGLAAGSRVLLHQRSDTSAGARTIIHEIGHTLGLPDYYQAPGSSSSQAGGILTADMMNNNMGDHDGFSKWMLGWLDAWQVTWVTVRENGVLAVNDGQRVGTLTEDGGLQLDLAPFTSNDVATTGGIIVIADHSYDEFSSYYVLQYDNFAGNQSLWWGIEDWSQLSSGFRLYRVQAAVNEDGELIDTNLNGRLHDQLIELVDPDGYLYHEYDADNNIADTAEDGDRWGCMFYAGDTISPSTSPSTNFYENASAGFTGISIEFTRSDADGGTIVVRYDGSEKPSGEPPTLTCLEGRELVNGATVWLIADTDITLSDDVWPYILLDNGKQVACTSFEVRGNLISLKTAIDTDVLASANSAEVVFEEGAFVLFDGSVSPEVAVPVPIGGIDLSGSGVLDGGSYGFSSYGSLVVSMTELFEDETGVRYFYQCDHERPYVGERTFYKNIIDATDPTKVTKVLILGDEAEKAQEIFLEKSALSETSPADRVGYLVPEGADLGEYVRLLDAVKVDGRIYVLSQSWDGGGNLLSVFEEDGTPVGSALTPYSNHYNGRVLVGPTGVVAVTVYSPFFSTDQQEITYFYDTDLTYIDKLVTNGTACSGWLDDGRFIAYGWRYDRELAPGASVTDPFFSLCYDITVPLGEAATGGWVQYQGAWYYQAEDGHWLANEWLEYEGAWYHFAANGTCEWNAWVKTGNYWYYVGKDGKAVWNTWVQYKGYWYHFDAKGRCEWNAWVSYEGNWYYVGADGRAVWNTWAPFDGREYYINSKGIATGESRAIA